MIEINAVLRCPRFSGISKPAAEWLSARFTRVTYEKRAFLFSEGDPCEKLFIIERGAIKVFKTLESGRELILNILRSGESVGEIALIDRGHFPGSAVAHEDSLILELKKSDYQQIGSHFPEILFSTIRDLTQRVRVMTQRMHELGSGSVEARLAQLFLTLSRSGREHREGILIPFSIGRQELADMIGVRVETVIRVMSRWHKNETLRTKPFGFIIPDRNRLESVTQLPN